MEDQIRHAREAFQAADTPFRDYVLAELKKLEDKIPDLKYAYED
jgi:phage shock protein A